MFLDRSLYVPVEGDPTEVWPLGVRRGDLQPPLGLLRPLRGALPGAAAAAPGPPGALRAEAPWDVSVQGQLVTSTLFTESSGLQEADDRRLFNMMDALFVFEPRKKC